MENRSEETGQPRIFAVPVQVRCGSHRCLGYRDAEGIWRDYHTGCTLTDPVHIVEFIEPEGPNP